MTDIDRVHELFRNRMTPCGMLMRALRIVSNTTLMDLAKHTGETPAYWSSREFGRAPMSAEDLQRAADFFESAGLGSTHRLLVIAEKAEAATHQQEGK